MSGSGIAFTLPISCQICLGKVKQPVVCPNQHVFCSPCMDVWLQRSQHCPACRTPVNDQNPCKQILGGLSQDGDVKEDFSKNRELIKARADVLFKEYEEELDRLQNEMETLKNENKVFAEKIKQYRIAHPEDGSEPPDKKDHPDVETLLNLTKKLQETMSSQEKLKKERDRVKKENNYLKDENVNLGRENQQLRMELTSRSPRKYGRLAAVAMETKLESTEKENKLLQKALERSDLYVEEMEKELEKYWKFVKHFSKCPNCATELRLKDVCGGGEEDRLDSGKEKETSDTKSRSQVNSKSTLQRATTWPVTQNVEEKKEQQKKPVITGISFYGRKVTPVKNKTYTVRQGLGQADTNGRNRLFKDSAGSTTPKKSEDSFGLEHPSPVTPSTSLRRLALDDDRPNDNSMSTTVNSSKLDTTNPGEGTSTMFDSDINFPSSSDNSLTESCRKKLRFDSGKDDIFNRPSTSGISSDSGSLSNSQLDSKDSTLKSNIDPSFDANLDDDESLIDQQPKLSDITKLKLKQQKRDDTFEMPSSTSESEDQDDTDHNMTNDIAECMQLLDEAEKKVIKNQQNEFKAPLPPGPITSSSSAPYQRNLIKESKWKMATVNQLANGPNHFGNNSHRSGPSAAENLQHHKLGYGPSAYDSQRQNQHLHNVPLSQCGQHNGSKNVTKVQNSIHSQVPAWYTEMESSNRVTNASVSHTVAPVSGISSGAPNVGFSSSLNPKSTTSQSITNAVSACYPGNSTTMSNSNSPGMANSTRMQMNLATDMAPKSYMVATNGNNTNVVNVTNSSNYLQKEPNHQYSKSQPAASYSANLRSQLDSLSQNSVSTSGFGSRDYDPSNLQSVNFSQPSLSQPGFMLSQQGYTMSQPGYTQPQLGNSLSQPGNTLSQPGNTLSQPGITLSQTGNSLSQNGYSH